MGNIRIFVFTIFPQIIECYTQYGIVKQAIKKKKAEIITVNLRDFAEKGVVDDVAYGGVPGMVLKPEPIFRAYEEIIKRGHKPYVLITEPWGRIVDQSFFEEMKKKEELLIICGRYEGVDERVKRIVDEEVSLGDFVLSGGEIVALALIEGIVRLIPGVVGDEKSIEEDSFRNRWLGYPVYTRPREFKGMKVPEVLTSGNHKIIELWLLWKRIENTYKKRRDKIPASLSPLEREIVDSIKKGMDFEEWIASKNL